ncbi:MAG: epoxyqueuosine reductase [Eubacteriaceae bacterium]|nr:epoxyqueuosine reductase [Eubacteriaceae bacterium]
MNSIAADIVDKAISLGYADCGIIKISDVAGYEERLKEHMPKVRLGRIVYREFMRFAHPQNEYPWTKSIIVVLNDNSCYNIPQQLNGVIAKHYLTDGRMDKNSGAFNRRIAFTDYLGSIGVKSGSDPQFGITALRYAARKAGIGIIRKNNFLYTKNGSTSLIEAFAIDCELEAVREEPQLQECAENCTLCIDACPSKALSEPYNTSLLDCISFMNTLSVERGLRFQSLKRRKQFGSWIYGCDACQDACPHNASKWKGGQDFPGLNEIAQSLLPENILLMDYAEMERVIAPKFWYVSKANLWKWKINALTVMENNYIAKYKEPILIAANDEKAIVRLHARKTGKRLGIL